MRSIKSKVLAACAWAAPVLAAALPAAHELEAPRPRSDDRVFKLDYHNDYAQATFSVPCNGCLSQDHTSQDDESLLVSFKAHAHDQPCGSSNITVNGVHLPQEWNGDFASGFGSYPGIVDFTDNDWNVGHDLDLEWESTCLHGDEEDQEDAQVFIVDIKAIDGKPVHKPSGFTISFHQQSSPPELLRLEPTPDRSASKDHAAAWRKPPTHLRLILPNAHDDVSPALDALPSSIEDDVRELRALQAKVEDLNKAISEKKKNINAQLEKEAYGLKEELSQCDSITCVVKTIVHKAQGAWRVVYIRFRRQHPNTPPPPPSSMDEHKTDHFASEHFPGSPAHIQAFSSPPPHHPPPPPGHRHGPPRQDHPFTTALEIVLGILCCGCVATAVRRKYCGSPSEAERQNAHVYRPKTRRHPFCWWRRNRRDQERVEDYEEKRALISNQEDVLEEAMQEEIRQLRAAHGVVNDLVREAEEGRMANSPQHTQCYCHTHHHYHPQASYSPLSTASTYPPTSIPELPSRPLSRTDSLPAYRSDASSTGAPPAYEEDEDRADMVANGFREYAPSTMSSEGSHWTPDSSIIDVSPRPSADTTRYAETTDTGVGDEKN